MAQQVKVCAVKPGDLSLTTRTHVEVEGKINDSVYIHEVALMPTPTSCVRTHTYTHTEEKNKQMKEQGRRPSVALTCTS